MSTPVLKIKVLPKPVIRGKMDVQFPAKVETEEFLTVARANGTYTFGADFSVLTPGPVSNPETAFVAIEDQTAGIYRTVSLASLLTSGLDADLQAIAALTSTGILARTADDTWELRTITGTANEIAVTNGDGVSGNPTISLPDALTFTGKTVTGGTFESPVIHTPTGIVKGDVGLGNVDNTSDADKPVSTATQTALDLKATTTDLAAVATSGSYIDLSNKPYTVPVGGTTGQALVKASGTDGDTEWGDATGSGGASTVATVTALKGLATSSIKTTVLTADGRAGIFNFLAGDYSTHVSTDTNEGVYIKADDTAATSGAWVRLFDFVTYYSRWFGTVNDYSTDNTTVINSIIEVANLVNTLTTAGDQAAAFIEIEGGVQFASTSLSFLPSDNWIFVYLRYFSQSDTTRGVYDFAGTTNERKELSVNSGYPNNASGGMVAEWVYNAPLHPAIIVNAAKQISGADDHFGTGQVRLPTSTNPVRASYNIKDENVMRWRVVYEQYGSNSEASGTWIQPFRRDNNLANVGSTGWPTIPANGTVITGVTSGAKMVKVGHNSTAIEGTWLQGEFVPGEKITDGVTTSTNGITGGGVANSDNTLPSLIFGSMRGVLTYGFWPGFAVTAFTVGGRMTLAPTVSSIATEHLETVSNAALLFTNTIDAIPSAGRQIVLGSSGDASNQLVAVNGVAAQAGATGPRALVNAVNAACTFNGTPAVLSGGFNVSSISYLGAGSYRVNFATAMANATFQCVVSATDKACNLVISTKNTLFVVINNFNSAGTATDLTGTVDVLVVGGM